MSQLSDHLADSILTERRAENERCLELQRQRAEMWQDLLRKPDQPAGDV